jgi:hypothetical protein
MFAESNNCGARETAIANEWLWNNNVSRQRPQNTQENDIRF